MKMRTLFTLIFGLFLLQSFAQKTDNAFRDSEILEYTDLPNLNRTGRDQVREFPDSIRWEFPDLHAIVVWNIRDVDRDTINFSRFQTIIGSWAEIMEAAVADTSVPHVNNITYTYIGEAKMDIKPNTAGTKVSTLSLKTMELLPTGWEIKAVGPHERIYIYAQSLAELKMLAKQDYSYALQKIKSGDGSNLRAVTAKLVMQDGEVKRQEIYRSTAMDYLSLMPSAGFGYANGNFYPELGARMTLNFSNYMNVFKHRIDVSNTFMFFAGKNADGSFKTNINSFINLSYNYNLADSNDDPSWIGFGAGYSLKESGGIFQKNTVKLFVNKSFGSFTVSPELYIGHGKNVGAGFKVAFSF